MRQEQTSTQTQSTNAWVESLLTPSQIESVNQSVARAEKGTTGEIVPMIVRRSSMIGHVKIIVALSWLLFIATLDIIGTTFMSDLSVWYYEKFGADFSLFLMWATAIAALLTIPLAYYLSRVDSVQRCLTPDADMDFEVIERAQLEFYWANLQKTEGRTGILIFLSLMERECVVLADQGISKLLPKETWDEVVKTVIGGIKEKKASEGLSKAVLMCGEILAKHFPASAQNPNELANHLIVKE